MKQPLHTKRVIPFLLAAVLIIVILLFFVFGLADGLPTAAPPPAQEENKTIQEEETEIASISDENYILTLEKTATSEHHTLAVISVEGLHESAVSALWTDDFMTLDSFTIKPFSGSSLTYSSLSMRELSEQATDHKRYWAVTLSNVSNPERTALILRPSFMNADPNRILLSQETLLDTLEIRFHDESAGEVYVQLSPIGIYMEKNITNYYFQLGYDNAFFRMADGTVKTYNQLFSDSYGSPIGDWEGDTLPYQTSGMAREILDLTQFKSVIIEETEYAVLPPHEAAPVEIPESLKPILLIPFYEDQGEEDGRFLLPLKNAFEKLEAELNVSEDGRGLTIRYRGEELTVTEGADHYILNGKQVAAPAPAVMINKTLHANGSILSYFNVGIHTDTTRDFPNWTWYLLP